MLRGIYRNPADGMYTDRKILGKGPEDQCSVLAARCHTRLTGANYAVVTSEDRRLIERVLDLLAAGLQPTR